MTDAEKLDVYEHGIEAVNGPPEGLLRLATRAGHSIDPGYTMAILDQDSSSLNRRAALLFEEPDSQPAHGLGEEYDLRNCLLGVLYYLNRIIDMYTESARLFETTYPDTETTGDRSDQPIYFEVVAFLSSACHIYDLISKILWKHYARGESDQWLGIKTALKSKNVIPAAFDTALKSSWATRGEKLTAYRDCLMHSVPLWKAASTIWMNRFAGRWGATVLLPTNPQAISPRALNTGSNGIDAASYCHGVVSELVALCEKLVAQPEISAYVTNPPTPD